MPELDERERSLRVLYQGVLLRNAEGRALLAHLLSRLGYAGPVTGAEEEIRRNVAVEILETLGVIQDFNFGAFVDALVAVPTEEVDTLKRAPQKRMETIDRIGRWKDEVR